MVRTRALRFLLILGLIALLIPVGLAQAEGPSGTATIRDVVVGAEGTFEGAIPVTVESGALHISMSDVGALPEDMAYEAWLVSDDGERKQSAGILEVAEDGSVNHQFKVTDEAGEATGENLFEAFNTFVITVEPVPDSDPAPSGEIAFKGSVSDDVTEQVRLLHVSGGETGSAYAVGLRQEVKMAFNSARQAQAAASSGDLEAAGPHIACVIEVIQGSADCGDGVGIVNYALSIVDTATAAQEAAAPDDMAVADSTSATIGAANSTRERADQAVAAAALAAAATTSQVMALHLGNVVEHLGGNGATGSAEMAYADAQDIGSYTVASLPSTGDPLVPQMARYGLIGGFLLVLLGSMMAFATRRRSSAAAA